MREIHRWPLDSPHNYQQRWKCFQFMVSSWKATQGGLGVHRQTSWDIPYIEMGMRWPHHLLILQRYSVSGKTTYTFIDASVGYLRYIFTIYILITAHAIALAPNNTRLFTGKQEYKCFLWKFPFMWVVASHLFVQMTYLNGHMDHRNSRGISSVREKYQKWL